MRIVIRGARGAGKTSMLQRLQGQRWSDRYVPTPEIGTAHINWSYKTRDDIVKVSLARGKYLRI
jgi:GTPase SAR1 family protein